MSNLVDRDILIKRLRQATEQSVSDDFKQGLIDARRILINMPIETKPEAYWVERFDDEDKWLECSNCHCDGDNAYNFCPNCGANMR